MYRIKIGSVFLCYFLLQSQKKVEQFDASKRCDEDARKFGTLFVLPRRADINKTR